MSLTQSDENTDDQTIQEELLSAARFGEIDEVTKLVCIDAALVNYQDEENGNTALHMASANNHNELVEFLLSIPQLLMLENKSGNTALHWAVQLQNKNVVKIILNHKGKATENINVKQKNKFGKSVVQEAINTCNREIIEEILKHPSVIGADSDDDIDETSPEIENKNKN